MASLPESYSALPTKHIKLSHVPESSPIPTPVLVLTLNRPEKLNAFTRIMSNEMVDVFRQVDVDDRVKVVIVTGSGKMAFCVGADLDIGFPRATSKSGERNTTPTEREKDHRDRGGSVSLAIHNCRKPTIMALNGTAVGIGITMALPASIRLATAGSKIGFVFSRRGIVTEAVSSFFLPRLIGHSRALHLITTGSNYPVEDRLLGDLFSEVLPTAEQTMARALELANDIANNTSVVATSISRELMYRGPHSAEETHLLDSSLLFGLFGKADNEEGVRSFLEKRNPQFTGSFNNPDDLPMAYPWWNRVDVSEPRYRKESKL